MTTPAASQSQDLRRVIGFAGGTALIVGITIGSGIFRTPPTIAGLVPNPLVIMALWTAFGLVSICGALALAELSTMLPRAGGVYVFLREAYGDAAAFVFGWLYVLITTPTTIAALSVVFAEFLFNLLGVPASARSIQLIAIAAIITLTGANVLGARVGAAVSEVTTLVKVTALAAIILGAFLLGHGSLSHITAGGTVHGSGLARAVAAVIWTYDGWIAVSMIAGEVVAPERMMKRIIITGMLIIVTLYIGANLAYLYMMPVSVMAQQKEAIARTVMTAIAGPAGGVLIMLAIMTSVYGALNGNLLAKPRVPYAMARDGLIFSLLGRTHPRWGTPWVAVLIQGVVGIIMVLALKDYDSLTTYFVVVEWAALIFAVGALFVLRRKMAEAPRPFRTPAYPWVPLLFILGTVLGLSAIVWGQIQVHNFSPVYGLGIAVAGFPVHYLWKRLQRRRMRKAIVTEKAPKPVGPYSQAIIDGDFIFVAGQGPINPLTGKLELGDARSETKRVFENLRAILEAAGSSLDHVVKCNVYLRDINDFAAMNEVYATYFTAPFPARTTIQAGALPGGIGVEIECIAKKGK